MAIGNLDAAAEIPGVTIFHAEPNKKVAACCQMAEEFSTLLLWVRMLREVQRRAYHDRFLIDWPERFLSL